jgi:phosphoribosylformylglycinamidine cyclo-ligase
MTEGMTYKSTGVDYDAMDPFKVACQEAALSTSHNARLLDFEMDDSTRGESAPQILYRGSGFYSLTHVEEGLGSKNLIADAMYKLMGRSYYDAIAQDTVAMIINDVITSGAYPLSVAMHLAVGDGDWFKDKERATSLAWGWANACNLAQAVWIGGETPTLKGIVNPETVVLAGSAVGIIPSEKQAIKEGNICEGDDIIHVGSSGIHANGLTMANTIGQQLGNGYLTEMFNGIAYGDAILTPTRIYSRILDIVEMCPEAIHYLVNITGHGWRKHMRPRKPWAYIIDDVPQAQAEFYTIQDVGNVTNEEMYGNFNMGVGFAVYSNPADTSLVIEELEALGFTAWKAGHIESSDAKKVVINPLNIEFSEDTLNLR